MLERLLENAYQELNIVHEFDTTSSLLAQYEVVEDLAYASRRHREQFDLTDTRDLDIFCLDNPGTVECRIYEI
jgi:hypothetical protein